MRYRMLFIVALMPWFVIPAHAGIFGRKKEKVEVKDRVPELLAILENDRDGDKRARAAEELRNYDGAAYPQIIPALVKALQQDKKPNVRGEAAQSLGKLRPVSQAAGDALESALANDPSMRVRMQARSALLHYHWAGYRSGKKSEVPPLNHGKEPPLAGPPGQTPTPPAVSTTPTVMPAPAPTTTRPGLFPSFRTTTPKMAPAALTPPGPSTKEPPLAAPLPAPVSVPAPAAAPPRTAPVNESGPELP